MSADRGNIVIIQCDSMDGRAMGCMGHPAMGRATPHLDALAAGGVHCRQTYSNNAICVPSRASTWSGQYTHRCGGWNNFKGLEAGTPTFQTRLQEAGYLTTTFGKTDYLSGEHTARARVTAWTRSAPIDRPGMSDYRPYSTPDREPRLRTHDWEDVESSIRWLGEAKSAGRPFMLYLGIRAPHPGFRTNQHYLERIDADRIPIPPPDQYDHPMMRYTRRHKNWLFGHEPDMVRLTRQIYYAMICEVDAMVGRLLEGMKGLGLGASNTCIVFTSDHGEMAHEHRQCHKMTLYEPAVRVPLIVAGPDMPAGLAVDELVSLVDLYPTLMDWAGRPQPAGLDGQSLSPLLRGDREPRPEGVLAEYHDCACSTGSFMLRRGDWKYIAYVGAPPMLFNLREDPWEVCNLAPQRPDVAAEMDAALRQRVDCEKIDAAIKAHDKASFRAWREQQLAAGTYHELMSRIFSGWDVPEKIVPWSAEDEAKVEHWLAENPQ